MVNMIMMMMIKIIIEVGEITIYCNEARLQKQMKCILKRIKIVKILIMLLMHKNTAK